MTVTPATDPDVTVAHDYFTQRGGAERVAAALVEAIGARAVVTASIEIDHTFPLGDARVRTTFLQRVGPLRRDPRWALALLPLAWWLMPKVRSGVLVCSSSGWSHRLRAGAGVPKVVYCHNPPRWLHQTGDYSQGLGRASRLALRVLRPGLLRGDRAAARTASLYLANSAGVADRIRTAYGIEAEVVHPPVTVDVHAERQRPPGVPEGDFFLTVARGRAYKNTARLIEAFRLVPEAHLVVVGPVAAPDAPPNVHTVGFMTEAELRWLYAGARALVSVSAEDFGLTPIEANCFGTPALLVRAGGFAESTDEHVSGEFIDDTSETGIAAAVRAFPLEWDRAAVRAHAERFSLDTFMQRIRRALDGLGDAPSPGRRRGRRDDLAERPGRRVASHDHTPSVPASRPTDSTASGETRWR